MSIASVVKRLWSVALVVVFSTVAAQGAYRITEEKISVVAERLPAPDYAMGGYREYRFGITNEGAVEREVQVVVPRQLYDSQVRSLTVRRTVSPGATVSMSVWQSPLAMTGSDARVVVDGRSYTVGLRIEGNVYNPYGSSYNTRVLVSQGAVKSMGQAFQQIRTRLSGGYGDEPVTESNIACPQWSTHWLGYSTFDTVAIDRAEIEKLPAEVSAALQDYVAAGGNLLVMGSWSAPADWHARMQRPGHWTLGMGTVRLVGKPGSISMQELGVQGSSGHVAVGSRGQAWSSMPVVENVGINVGGVFVLMIVFAVVIGPVNLLVLSRMNRRILMLVTVPVISLLTCGGVFVYAVVSEGWTPNVRVGTVTLLDEKARRAVTVGGIGYYCPMAPSGGLHFTTDTELTPHVGQFNNMGFGYGGGGDQSISGTVDWTQDQHLEGSWIQARVPLHFSVRKVQRSRLRLTFSGTTDARKVANGLGVDIERLLVVDHDGQVYRARNVAAGAEATLERTGLTSGVGEVSGALGDEDPLKVAGKMARYPDQYLRRNCYLAITRSALVETGLDDPEMHHTLGIVYGLMKEPLR